MNGLEHSNTRVHTLFHSENDLTIINQNLIHVFDIFNEDSANKLQKSD